MPRIEFETSLKSMREALCIAQVAIGNHPVGDSPQRTRWIMSLQELIGDIDRQRPIGPDGKHGDRHTATCGCEDGNPFYHEPTCSAREECPDQWCPGWKDSGICLYEDRYRHHSPHC